MLPFDLLAVAFGLPLELFQFLAQNRFDFDNQGGLIGTLVLVLDIVAIISVLLGRGSVGHKLLWTLMILLLPCVGMVLYFIFGRSPKDA
jgi:hypothetical protein